MDFGKDCQTPDLRLLNRRYTSINNPPQDIEPQYISAEYANHVAYLQTPCNQPFTHMIGSSYLRSAYNIIFEVAACFLLLFRREQRNVFSIRFWRRCMCFQKIWVIKRSKSPPLHAKLKEETRKKFEGNCVFIKPSVIPSNIPPSRILLCHQVSGEDGI